MSSASEPSVQQRTHKSLGFWRNVVTRSLEKLPLDLSNRQMGILLTVYLEPPPHTIRGLAEGLHISKPAVCRAVDVLEQAKLLKRVRDEKDMRNVHLQRTVKGSVFLSECSDLIVQALKEF